jgi:nucleotide-binding universal stress UspA family protein
VTARRRILFPFVGATLSRAKLEEALRSARAEGAVLAPVYLATVPAHLSLDAPLPKAETELALAMLELIEQLATREGVPVDSRIERGRSPREALANLIENERYDALVEP